MNSDHVFLIITISFLMTLSSCIDIGSSADRTVVASVSGKNLTLDEALSNIPEHILQQDSLRAVNSYINQWVQNRVAVDHAQRIGLQNTDQFQRKMDRYRDQLLETMLHEMIIAENEQETEVSDEEAQNYYMNNRDQFLLDEKYVRFRHIITRTRTEAENANRDIAAGLEWEEVAEQYSINPELQIRHSTQFWPVSMAAADVPPVNNQLQIMGITERSPIFFFRGQYHWVQLIEERTEGEYPDLEWLIPQIKEWLKLEKTRRLVNAYLRNLYLQAETNNEIELKNVSELESLLSN